MSNEDNGSPVQVSRCGQEEAEAIAGLHDRIFPGAPWNSTSLALLMAAPGAVSLVARAEAGPITGFILCQAAMDEAEILTLGVDVAARRMGVARQLVTQAARILAEAGVKRIVLEVGDDNTAGLALYRSLGFLVCGRRRDYYIEGRAQPVDALILDWAIGRA